MEAKSFRSNIAQSPRFRKHIYSYSKSRQLRFSSALNVTDLLKILQYMAVVLRLMLRQYTLARY